MHQTGNLNFSYDNSNKFIVKTNKGVLDNLCGKELSFVALFTWKISHGKTKCRVEVVPKLHGKDKNDDKPSCTMENYFNQKLLNMKSWVF